VNRTAINQKANQKLHKMFWDKGIFLCEANLEGCERGWMLSYAHRHKRLYYYDKPDELLWDYKEVILACLKCHNKMEKSKELTEQVFNRLREPEELQCK
jgi:hypothetical protein